MNKSLTDKTIRIITLCKPTATKGKKEFNSFKRLNDNSPERKHIIFTRRLTTIESSSIE